jgi:hypothetical protein
LAFAQTCNTFAGALKAAFRHLLWRVAKINNDEGYEVRFVPATGTVLLWVAIGLAVLFIGLLIYDQVRRRRPRHRRLGEPRPGFRAALRRPFQQAKRLREELRSLARERARRKQRDEKKRPGTKR